MNVWNIYDVYRGKFIPFGQIVNIKEIGPIQTYLANIPLNKEELKTLYSFLIVRFNLIC